MRDVIVATYPQPRGQTQSAHMQDYLLCELIEMESMNATGANQKKWRGQYNVRQLYQINLCQIAKNWSPPIIGPGFNSGF